MADDGQAGTPAPKGPPDTFSRPPPEVTRYFEAKGIKPTFHWLDVEFDEHAVAFTVARSAGFDILGDVKAAVAKAIDERQDFDAFKAGLEPLLKAKGWWGEKATVDPATGETVSSQLGSASRLETIYNANVRTAFAAGQWERQWRTRRVLPFLLYLISTAEHKRELHLEWVGTILPIDDPWWDTHYPPNGWNCQCRVRQISDVEAKLRKYDPEEPAPDHGFAQFFNKRTGDYVQVPAGIDPGWAGNPGKMRTSNAANLIAGRLDGMSEEERRVAIGDIVGDPLVKRIAEGRTGYDPDNREDQGNVMKGRIAMPVATLAPEWRAAVGAETGTMRLSVADGAKQAAKRRTRPGGAPIAPSRPAEAEPITSPTRRSDPVPPATPDAVKSPDRRLEAPEPEPAGSPSPVANPLRGVDAPPSRRDRPAAPAATAGTLSVSAADYAKVQQLIDHGEVIKQGDHDLVFQGDIDGKPWVAVLRRAAKAVAEIYLKSFRRQEPRQAEVYRKRGTVLRHPRHTSPSARGPDESGPR